MRAAGMKDEVKPTAFHSSLIPHPSSLLSLVVLTRDALKFFQFALETCEVLFNLRAQVFSVKSDRRVIADQILATVALDDAPARFVNTFHTKHCLRGNAAEQHYQLRINQLYLLK